MNDIKKLITIIRLVVFILYLGMFYKLCEYGYFRTAILSVIIAILGRATIRCIAKALNNLYEQIVRDFGNKK